MPARSFPVFGADLGKADLEPIGTAIVGLITHALEIENLPMNALGPLDPGNVTVARTALGEFSAT
jgi:hypothetical protein